MTSLSRITIRDVAAHAGVSHQTVSRVINNSKRVLPETRARVQASIQELGYHPNAIARSMALGWTDMLACVAPSLADRTYSSLIEGAENKAREMNFFLIASFANTLQIFDNILKELIDSNRVAGMIVIHPYIDKRYQLLREAFPFILVGGHSKSLQVSTVNLNDELAAFDATVHLISKGHRRIAMFTGPMTSDSARDRCAGFERAIRQAGFEYDPTMVIEGDWSATSGQDALIRLAQVGQLPTAIFAQNDRMAIGAIQAARKLGRQVPRQLSVIGVDDIPLASYFDPALTTMRQDIIRIGSEATRLLIEEIENPDLAKRNVSIKADLVVRNSTCSVPV